MEPLPVIGSKFGIFIIIRGATSDFRLLIIHFRLHLSYLKLSYIYNITYKWAFVKFFLLLQHAPHKALRETAKNKFTKNDEKLSRIHNRLIGSDLRIQFSEKKVNFLEDSCKPLTHSALRRGGRAAGP